MCQKLPKMVCYIHKLELPTMRVQKSGKISHMILNRIFGPWGVLFMKWQPSSLHLREKIWKDFSNPLLKEFIHLSRRFTPENFQVLLS
jgi:hypothetical protein